MKIWKILIHMTLGAALITCSVYAIDSLGKSYNVLSYSHTVITDEDVEKRIKQLRAKARAWISPEELVMTDQIFAECRDSVFWRFYLMNGTLNGTLTEFMTLYPENKETSLNPWGDPITSFEREHFESPLIMAYQQNHILCKTTVQKHLQSKDRTGEKLKVASVACGTLYEFRYIPTLEHASLEMFGYENDEKSLKLASAKASEIGRNIVVKNQDPQNSLADAPFDVIIWNGSSFYMANDEKLLSIFSNFNASLKDGGIAIISFILPRSEWNHNEASVQLKKKAELWQKLIPSKWTAAFRSYDTMTQIAMKAGFLKENIEFLKEKYNTHPSIVLKKS